MLALIALVLIAIVAVTVAGYILHMLFFPLVLVAIATVLWMKFRPSRSRR